ncbi:ABC transporter ATP-binding protein [Bacteroidia bacterium]|nr:ABC transporter ATP-binding protein [Bacteroidia bacterium]
MEEISGSLKNIRRILRLLPVKYRKRGIWVAASVCLRALLNFIGLTALIPLITSAIEPEKGSSLPLCLAVFAFIVFKNMVNVWLGGVHIHYINQLYCHFSEKLYKSYFRKGLLFVKQTPSDSLSNRINGVCYRFSQSIVSQLFTVSGEALLLFFIWTGLFIYSYQTALWLSATLFPALWIYLFVIRKKLRLYGQAENEIHWKQWRLVTETFKGYAEVTLSHAFPLFFKRFKAGLEEITRYREHSDRIHRLPESMMEIYIIGGWIVAALLSKGGNDLKLTLGIIAVATVRMLPSVRNLLNGWVLLKNNAYTIDIVGDALLSEEQEGEPALSLPFSFCRQIEIRDLTFAFTDAGAGEQAVIRHFNLILHKGERIGIRGASGAGKSTLFNLLLGFYTPQQGEICIDGVRLDCQNRSEWHRIVGYVPQDVFILDGTLAENIALGEESINEERLKQALRQSNLDEFVRSLPEGIHTPIGENGCRLSGGQRQRIGIARALYKQAEVLFFDEATSSLDSQTEQEITGAINRLSAGSRQLTILIIAHRETSLAGCDRVVDLS